MEPPKVTFAAIVGIFQGLPPDHGVETLEEIIKLLRPLFLPHFTQGAEPKDRSKRSRQSIQKSQSSKIMNETVVPKDSETFEASSDANAPRNSEASEVSSDTDSLEKTKISKNIRSQFQKWIEDPRSFWDESIEPLQLTIQQNVTSNLQKFFKHEAKSKSLLDVQIIQRRLGCVLMHDSFKRHYPRPLLQISKGHIKGFLEKIGISQNCTAIYLERIRRGQKCIEFCKRIQSDGGKLDYGPLFLDGLPDAIWDTDQTHYRNKFSEEMEYLKSKDISTWSQNSGARLVAELTLNYLQQFIWPQGNKRKQSTQDGWGQQSEENVAVHKRARVTAVHDAPHIVGPNILRADSRFEPNLPSHNADPTRTLQFQPLQSQSVIGNGASAVAWEHPRSELSTGEQYMASDSLGNASFTVPTPSNTNTNYPNTDTEFLDLGPGVWYNVDFNDLGAGNFQLQPDFPSTSNLGFQEQGGNGNMNVHCFLSNNSQIPAIVGDNVYVSNNIVHG
ncbi:hypothetical protein PT974_05189 [Cladobotryum mycophilum]|uniref:Uncharacterized protein n=1 Tax=Cladobotryum mycophilum TaxID=491253 RepID=A0ABR0SRA7_9HYPO